MKAENCDFGFFLHLKTTLYTSHLPEIFEGAKEKGNMLSSLIKKLHDTQPLIQLIG